MGVFLRILRCVLYAETCSRQTEKVAHRHWNMNWKQCRSVTLNAAGRPNFAVFAFEGILSISGRSISGRGAPIPSNIAQQHLPSG